MHMVCVIQLVSTMSNPIHTASFQKRMTTGLLFQHEPQAPPQQSIYEPVCTRLSLATIVASDNMPSNFSPECSLALTMYIYRCSQRCVFYYEDPLVIHFTSRRVNIDILLLLKP